MKLKKLAVLLGLMMISIPSLAGCNKKQPEPQPQEQEEEGTNHLIKNADGSVGGTTNLSLYGEGTPLNGEYNVENDEYFAVNDYYKAQSTSTRTMISGFRSYQQTMAKSDGISCALMILNNEGEDVADKYNELKLVQKYESLTGENVFEKGTTPANLKTLFTDLGYTASSSAGAPSALGDLPNWIAQKLKQNKYIMVRFKDGMEFNWHVIIGYETCGTDSTTDDVIIFADPFDTSDHCQDGYSIYVAKRFFRNKLAIVGLAIKFCMFVFAFIIAHFPIFVLGAI